jgi:hypothetical protein
MAAVSGRETGEPVTVATLQEACRVAARRAELQQVGDSTYPDGTVSLPICSKPALHPHYEMSDDLTRAPAESAIDRIIHAVVTSNLA